MESAAARICREGGARHRQRVGEGHGPPCAERTPTHDWKLWLTGCHFSVVCNCGHNLVSPLHCDGSPHRGAANIGAVLAVARHQEGDNISQADWSQCSMSPGGPGWRNGRALVRRDSIVRPWVLEKRVEQSWWFRWGSLLTCAPARAFPASLLDVRVSGGACHEVVHDAQHALIQ